MVQGGTRPFKLTWIFSSGPTGWSESYYFFASDHDGAEATAAFLRQGRLAVLLFQKTLTLVYQRLAEISAPYLTRLDAINASGQWIVGKLFQSPAWDGFQTLYEATGARTRSDAFRGSPRHPTGLWWLSLKEGLWHDWWQQNWVARVLQCVCLRTNQITSRRVPVASLVPDPATGGQVLATAPGHGLPLHQQSLVTFDRLRTTPVSVSGKHLVFPTDPDHFHIQGFTVGRLYYPGGGYFRQFVYEYPRIERVQIIRSGTRRIHRRFRLASWTTSDPAAAVGFHPCGLGMDVLSSAYTTQMRLGVGQGGTPMRWFFCPQGVLPCPGWHAFASHIWQDDWRWAVDDLQNVGELVPYRSPYAAGRPGAAWGYRHPCGPEVYFREGEGVVFVSLDRDLFGVPRKCGSGVLGSGGGQGSGSARFRLETRLKGSGGARGAGSATFANPTHLLASGGGSGAGSADFAEVTTLAGTGGGRGAGTAAFSEITRLTGSGGARGAGTATFTETTTLTASGGAGGAGSAAFSLVTALAGSGGAEAAGGAAFVLVTALAGSGGAGGAGTATFTETTTLLASGGAGGAGSAVTSLVTSLAGGGGSSASGSATFAEVTALAASGGAAAAGAALFSLVTTLAGSGGGSGAGSADFAEVTTLAGTGGGRGAGSAGFHLGQSLKGSGGGRGAGTAAFSLVTTLTASGGGRGAGGAAFARFTHLLASGGGGGVGSGTTSLVTSLTGAGGGSGGGGPATSARVTTLAGTGGGRGAGSATMQVVSTGPAFRASSSGDITVAAGASFTITLPAGTLSTDLVLLVIVARSSGITPAPAGWTQINFAQSSAFNPFAHVYLFWAAGSVSNLTFTDNNFFGSIGYGWVAASFSGCHTADQSGTHNSTATSSSAAAVTAPSLTTLNSTDFEVLALGAVNAGTWTATGYQILQNAGTHQDATLAYNLTTVNSGGNTPAVACSNTASTSGQSEAVINSSVKYP